MNEYELEGDFRERYILNKKTGSRYYFESCVDLLNNKSKDIENLNKIISDIDFALRRKYNSNIVDLLDEILDDKYKDYIYDPYDTWVLKQVKRGRKLCQNK